MTLFPSRALRISLAFGLSAFALSAFKAEATAVPEQVYVADAPKKVAAFPSFIRPHALPVENAYPSEGHAERDLKHAFEAAAKEHKLVLASFGANWSQDCKTLEGVLNLEELKPWINQNFILVNINVSRKEGKFNRNMEIAKRYGIVVKSLPSVLAFTPRATVLNADGTEAFGNAHIMRPQEIADLLNLWHSRAPAAERIEVQNIEKTMRAEAIAKKAKQIEEDQKKNLKKGQTLGTNYYQNGQIVRTPPAK
ncbi:thioredoxin family protein [Acetobacteraceae bacterium]|nr:thioredoxin family protein [Acetobacteraceae bacterium]